MIRSNLINYIKNTPENFNPTVFNSMLDTFIKNIQQFYKSSNLTKLEDYVYSINYDYIDYEAGATYASKFKMPYGGCSSISINKLMAHNYDWYYSNDVDFIVHTSAATDRLESYGMATVTHLDKALVESGNWDDFYAILPNLMLDGFNNYISCCINVVPNGDYGLTTGTNPSKRPLCGLQLCRFLLDNATSVDNAIELLSNRNIYMPHGESLSLEVHLMVKDLNKTCVIEFINNEMKVIDINIMTNFYTYNIERNSDGSVYTPYTQDSTHNAIITNNITPNGSGLERFNILNESQELISDSDDLLDLMKTLNFTNAYTNSPDEDTWYTEDAGFDGLTVISTPTDYTPILLSEYNKFTNRSRDTHDTWQTIHTAIYDLENLKLTVVCQEGSTEYEYELTAL